MAASFSSAPALLSLSCCRAAESSSVASFQTGRLGSSAPLVARRACGGVSETEVCGMSGFWLLFVGRAWIAACGPFGVQHNLLPFGILMS